MKVINAVYDFNSKAGFLGKGYSPYLEACYQIEEAIEGFPIEVLAGSLGSTVSNAKDLSRELLEPVRNDRISDVDALDKACDAVVFAIGSIAKLGLTPEQIEESLLLVMAYNQAKLDNVSVDEEGKLQKPENFTGPEEALQKILDRR